MEPTWAPLPSRSQTSAVHHVDLGEVTDGTDTSLSGRPSTAFLMPSWRRFSAAYTIWLYALLSGGAIVLTASHFIGPTKVTRSRYLQSSSRFKLVDDEHYRPLRETRAPPEPPHVLPPDVDDPFCRQRLVRVREG